MPRPIDEMNCIRRPGEMSRYNPISAEPAPTQTQDVNKSDEEVKVETQATQAKTVEKYNSVISGRRYGACLPPR